MEEELERSTSTRVGKILFYFIMGIVLLSAAGYWAGLNSPFEGKYDRVGIVEVDGSLDRVVLFCVDTAEGTQCKFLWKIAVESSELRNGKIVASLPQSGDVISVDVEDSRANLFIELGSTDCFRDVDEGWRSAVRKCEYIVTQEHVVLTLTEEIGSSGQPEWSGVPR